MSQPSTETSPGQSRDARRLRWFVYGLIIAVSSAVTLGRILSAGTLQSANDRSRWSTVWSLVERGTYVIDEIDARPGWTTIDKVRHEGHLYSSKPPLLATLVAGVYWAVKDVTGWTLLEQTDLVTDVILVLINLLPMGVALAVLGCLVERYAATDRARYFVMFTAAFGTLLTTFLTTLNNHTPAAVGLVFALYAALRITADGSRSPLLFASCGFFAAFVCTNEMPAALLGLALFGLLLARAPRQTLLYFVPAALVPLGAFFWTNYLATGGIKPFYTYYGTEKYLYIHDGVPSYWMQPRGLDANAESPLSYFLNCTIGHHGIFSLSPVFLLAIATWATIRRWKGSPLLPYLWMGLALTVVVLGFYLTRTENYNYGGNTSGLRWMFWLIPFWLLALIPAVEAWGGRRGFDWFCIAALGVSVFSAFEPLLNPWQQPWLYRAMRGIGLVEQPPHSAALEPPMRTWFRSLPSETGFGRGAWLELTGIDSNGDFERVVLRDRGLPVEGPASLRLIEVQDGSRTVVLQISVEQFVAGEPAKNFVVGAENTTVPAAVQSLQVLAEPRPYRAGSVQYVRTPLRETPFRCQHAAAQVMHPASTEQRPLIHRCDVWLCPDVPFGVVQMKQTITERLTGTVVSARTLQAVAASSVRQSPPH